MDLRDIAKLLKEKDNMLVDEKIDAAIKKLEAALAALQDVPWTNSGPHGRAIAVAKTHAETALLWAKHAREQEA
jgi:hypothetical protein